MLCHLTCKRYLSEQSTYIRFPKRKDTSIGIEITVVATCVTKRNMQVERGRLKQIVSRGNPCGCPSLLLKQIVSRGNPCGCPIKPRGCPAYGCLAIPCSAN